MMFISGILVYLVLLCGLIYGARTLERRGHKAVPLFMNFAALLLISVPAALLAELAVLQYVTSSGTPGLFLARYFALPASHNDILGNRWPLALAVDSMIVFMLALTVNFVRRRNSGR